MTEARHRAHAHCAICVQPVIKRRKHVQAHAGLQGANISTAKVASGSSTSALPPTL